MGMVAITVDVDTEECFELRKFTKMDYCGKCCSMRYFSFPKLCGENSDRCHSRASSCKLRSCLGYGYL